jgi:hypothetical protein
VSYHNHSGLVYFLACGRYVKIGYTSRDISTRIANLRNPQSRAIMPDDHEPHLPWRVVRLIPGCIMRDERRIHGLFAAHHAVGEFYHLTPELIAHIGRLDYRTDREVLAEFRRARRELKRRPSLAKAA